MRRRRRRLFLVGPSSAGSAQATSLARALESWNGSTVSVELAALVFQTNAEYFDFADNGRIGFSNVLALLRGV